MDNRLNLRQRSEFLTRLRGLISGGTWTIKSPISSSVPLGWAHDGRKVVFLNTVYLFSPKVQEE